MTPTSEPGRFTHEVTADATTIDANGHVNNVVFSHR
jgi:hypothetical protein